MRGLVSTALVAVVVSLLTVTAVGVIAQEPAQVGPAAVKNINVHRVDGKHAVGAGAGKAKRAGKLVATNSKGYLPANIVKPKWGLISGKPAGFADGVDNQGVTKITITSMVSLFTSIAAGSSGTATASCPVGSKAVGGGFNSNRFGLNVVDSFASSRSTKWTAAADNPTGASISLQAIVQCLSTTPSTAIATARKGAKIAKVN